MPLKRDYPRDSWHSGLAMDSNALSVRRASRHKATGADM